MMWIAAHVAGITAGAALGATDHGLISQILGTSIISHILGDLIFGGCIGLVQWFVLYKSFPQKQRHLWLWVPATMAGFAAGARLGARFAPLVGTNVALVGIAFGSVMGLCMGIGQWVVIHKTGIFKVGRSGLWIAASVVAWIIGESISFAFQFQLTVVPFIALAIALVTEVGLIWWIKPE